MGPVDLLVLWDVDYTLLSADGLGTRLYEVVFRELYGRELTAVAPKAGRTDRAIIGDTLALAGVSRAQVDAFLAALARHAAAQDGHAAAQAWQAPRAAGRGSPAGSIVRAQVRPMPGAAAAVAALAAAGTRQSVLTGNIKPVAALKLGLAGLRGHLDLDVGAYGDAHEVRSELVAGARLAASRAYGRDFGGRSTVLIGDTPLDVEAALATGARAVGVATGDCSAADLAAAGAHVVLPGLTDTARVVAAVTDGRAQRPGSWVSTAGDDRPSRAAGGPRPPRRRSGTAAT